MKFTILIIALITNSYISFAQEKQATPPKPNSKIGIMLGRQWWMPYDYTESSDSYVWEISKGIGITAFYNYTYDSNFFFQFSVNYNTYKTQTHEYTDIWGETGINTHKQPDDIVVTAGFNWWCYSDKIYIGAATGFDNHIGRLRWPFYLFYLQAGVSFPIPKYNISIEVNAKGGVTNSGINIGLAYLIP